MKLFLLLGSFFIALSAAFSQDMTKFKLYKPEENAKQAIEAAVKEAKNAGKHVLIQVGGNWCVWCARFEDFVNKDASLDSILKADYVIYHLNYSKENKNGDILKQYAYPQRFGYPVFLILNSKGDLIHTQNSWYLETVVNPAEPKPAVRIFYDKEKVMAFFKDWSPKAFDAALYKDDK